ncbi:DUF7146 domain-containing protein [Kaistia defluvii]|uniref:DUF7146 domain-containing protein n=1 Tax=Kaistia defluvii TaxID=410841 RepID=UPI0033921B04
MEEWKPAPRSDAPETDWVARMEARLRKSSDAASQPASNSNEAGDSDGLFGIALRMWDEAKPVKGSLAETYLQARGLWLPKNVEVAGQLRFHPSCAFKVKDGTTKRVPAMLALMTDPLTGEARAVHRTALKPDGSGKLVDLEIGNPKKMLGRMRGAVIRLCPDDEAKPALTIAEGIENALAGICGGVGGAWAAGTALNVQLLPVLPGVEALHILADAGKAGEGAASECGQRWADAGRKVEATFPTHGDWNDTMKGET